MNSFRIGVILGEFDFSTDPDCDGDICAEPVQIIKVEKEIVHTAYDYRTHKNDILLIKLQRSANLNGKNAIEVWRTLRLFVSLLYFKMGFANLFAYGT